MKALTSTLFQALAAVAFAAAIPVLATAAPTVEKLPRVVVTGKAVKTEPVFVAQLPRVVVEGRRTVLLALNSATEQNTRNA